MKRQIISRAFYGWLAYCRHLSTVRTHLSGLVHPIITCPDDANDGLTLAKWEAMMVDGVVTDSDEVFRLTYFGGVEHSLRKEVIGKIYFLLKSREARIAIYLKASSKVDEKGADPNVRRIPARRSIIPI